MIYSNERKEGAWSEVCRFAKGCVEKLDLELGVVTCLPRAPKL